MRLRAVLRTTPCVKRVTGITSKNIHCAVPVPLNAAMCFLYLWNSLDGFLQCMLAGKCVPHYFAGAGVALRLGEDSFN